MTKSEAAKPEIMAISEIRHGACLTRGRNCLVRRRRLRQLVGMKLKALLATFVIAAFTGFATAEPLEVGADAPKVKSEGHDGKEIDLGKKFEKGTYLVYFYPKADTPGCTKQACNLRDEFEDVKGAGIEVYGVSADTVKDQKAFADKFDLPFTLIADKKGDVIKAFGVKTNPKGMSARQSFLIRDGKVIWVDLKATPTTQAKDAIAAAKKG